jgi:hypothetical protein
VSADIGPGDWVECIHKEPSHLEIPQNLTIGAIYQVCEVGLWAWWFERRLPALTLVGHPSLIYQGKLARYAMADFRPVYRPSEKLIESLKTKVPA